MQLLELLTIFVALSETKVKNSNKKAQTMENKKRDDTAAITAQSHGVTAAYVRMVANGTRKNDEILKTYNTILETKRNLSQPAEPAVA